MRSLLFMYRLSSPFHLLASLFWSQCWDYSIYVIPWQTRRTVFSLNTATHLSAQFVVMTAPQLLDWDWEKSPQSAVSKSWLTWHKSSVCWLKSSPCQSAWNTKISTCCHILEREVSRQAKHQLKGENTKKIIGISTKFKGQVKLVSVCSILMKQMLQACCIGSSTC